MLELCPPRPQDDVKHICIELSTLIESEVQGCYFTHVSQLRDAKPANKSQ